MQPLTTSALLLARLGAIPVGYCNTTSVIGTINPLPSTYEDIANILNVIQAAKGADLDSVRKQCTEIPQPNYVSVRCQLAMSKSNTIDEMITQRLSIASTAGVAAKLLIIAMDDEYTWVGQLDPGAHGHQAIGLPTGTQ